MKKLLVLLTVVSMCMVALSGSAFAGTKAGDTELGVFATVASIDIDTVDDPITATILNLTVGHFITNSLQLGVGLLSVATDDGTNETTEVSVDGFAKYHFASPESTTVPYIGIQAGNATYDDGTNSNSVFSYGGMAGLKIFVSENTSYNVEYNYRAMEFDDGYSDPVDVSISAVLFGVSYYFGAGGDAPGAGGGM